MKIEDSKYILYFFAFFFFGSVASNHSFISFCEIPDTYACEKHQSHISDDSQNHCKDFYRRTYQNNPSIKNNKFIYITPASNKLSLVDCSAIIHISYFENIEISLDTKDMIYPFNYFF